MAHWIAGDTLGLTHPKESDTPKISIGAKDIDVVEWKGDILVIGVTENDLARDENSMFKNPLLQQLDSELNGLLSEASSEEDFSGKSGQSVILRLPGLGSKRIALVGLGSATSPAAYHSLGEAAAAAAKSAHASHIAGALASADELSAESKLSSASAIATGVVLGTFEDNRFRSESKRPTLESLDILGLGTGPEIEKKIKYAEDVCAGVMLRRELVNAPANIVTPALLAEEAKMIASTYSDVISVNILDAKQCKELKMGAYLDGATASANPAHFIHLFYKPSSGEIKKKIALVGKGLTFDSGSYNIKAGAGSDNEHMKDDMAGAAAVLGAAKALGETKPTGVDVHFTVAAPENMISGAGMRPGDIVTASNGKTFDVNNTDAEGRLKLADALINASEQGVEKIVDLATLPPSGGYNIKAGAGSYCKLMKQDMAGAAAILGAAKALGEIKPIGVEVHFIVAAHESMISGAGMRPGDIVTASNGKTFEVDNTDAEGRLKLADALINASGQGVEEIIDLATLPGAFKVALGPSVAGAFTPSHDLAKEVFAAAEASGEKLWRMPLEDSMKSVVADMINTGPQDGGAITAPLFLNQFVDEQAQWLHIDVADSASTQFGVPTLVFGVSTLVEWVLKNT